MDFVTAYFFVILTTMIFTIGASFKVRSIGEQIVCLARSVDHSKDAYDAREKAFDSKKNWNRIEAIALFALFHLCWVIPIVAYNFGLLSPDS